MRGAAPHPGSLAGCTRARNYVSRLVCGLGRRQQDGGSEWRGERDREEVGGRGWRCVRRRPAKPEEMELAGEGLWVWYKKNGGGKKLAGWHRKERCWRSGGVGLCEEVSREDVGLPAEKCAPRIFAPEKSALAFSVCRLNFVLLFSAAGAALPKNTKQ